MTVDTKRFGGKTWAAAFCAGLALGLTTLSAGVAVAEISTPRRDVAVTGLPPLFQALEAVSNCADLAVDQSRFALAMESYHLSREDLSTTSRFRDRLAELADHDRVRILDDREAFCSAARLQFLVKNGILKEAVR